MKHQLIITFASISICLICNSNAFADYCSNLGVTTGATCYVGNVPNNYIPIGINCNTSTSGCQYYNCTFSQSCECNNTGCRTAPTTDCSSITCNPIWGSIDNTTHIQTGKIQHPDTSNNCKCIETDTLISGSTIYRCIAGYYDSRTGLVMTGSKPTCAKCPSLGNNNVAGQSDTGFTDNPSNKGITSCYIPYNTEITDDTGTYKFISPEFSIAGTYGCYYKDN